MERLMPIWIDKCLQLRDRISIMRDRTTERALKKVVKNKPRS